MHTMVKEVGMGVEKQRLTPEKNVLIV